jgi:DNA-binding PadR family transcriptional regulator
MRSSPHSRKIPPLGYALLGLLQQKPSSGYDLRKIFSSTSMKTYSDSPGAIYPALRRLEREALIQGAIEKGSGLRRRQVFQLTAKGRAELKKWIAQPITPGDLTHGFGDIVLRFAFSENAAGPAASLDLLKSLHAALKPHIAELHKEFQASHKLMPTSGRLAFESGIRGTEHFLHWTEYAISTYEKQARKKGSAS